MDDVHWADAPSLRWLSHLAARIDGLPTALLLAVRNGPDEPALLDELRACPAARSCRSPRSAATRPPPWCAGGSASGRTHGCARPATPAPAGTRSCSRRWPRRCAGEGTCSGRWKASGRSRSPRPCCAGWASWATAPTAWPGPWPSSAARPRSGTPPALAGQDLPQAARLADQLRAADVLAPGSTLEFAHPIVRAAIYESIPPGERALAHAEAARLLERDGADPERLALHLLRSEPGGDAGVAACCARRPRAASGRGAPGHGRRVPAPRARRATRPGGRPAVLLDLGLALAGERSPDAAAVLREAVRLLTTPADHATAALRSARVLGLWAYHDSVSVICHGALAAGDALDPATADSLEAELFANATISAAHRRGAGPGGGPAGRPGRVQRLARERRPRGGEQGQPASEVLAAWPRCSTAASAVSPPTRSPRSTRCSR